MQGCFQRVLVPQSVGRFLAVEVNDGRQVFDLEADSEGALGLS